jgi:hypothetical protein
MRVFEEQQFDSFDDRDSGALFSDIEFRNCYFESCAVSITRNPNLRSTVRNVRLVNCSQRGCSIRTAIFEDVVVDGLKTHGQLLQCWSAVFNRVVMSGKIDRLMTSPAVSGGLATPEEQAAFDRANAEYYRGVDWALDISEAQFKELDLRGVPAGLVRRDPETQVVVRRERALEGAWRELSFEDNLWPLGISQFLDTGEEDMVLVAAKRHPKFRQRLEGLNLLRKAGVAEPD